jgi:predicted phosphoribosyltransferase
MATTMLFADRREAGRALARRLSHLQASHPLVLALPRGGVPVAYEVARALEAPLDVFLVRKLGVPGHEELAMGAIATGGVMVTSRSILQHLGVPTGRVREVALRESRELERRERVYRGRRPPLDVAGRTLILVDDGLATGSTMRAALRAIRALKPAHVVVAAPVASAVTCREIDAEADEVVVAATPEPFKAVGLWYGDFTETPDAEVMQLLGMAWRAEAAQRGEGARL